MSCSSPKYYIQVQGNAFKQLKYHNLY